MSEEPNKGTADPLLIACALAEQQNSSDMLIASEWRIVTDDGAVRRKAEEFGVAWTSSVEFLDTWVTNSSWS
jgi:hypothetical protein